MTEAEFLAALDRVDAHVSVFIGNTFTTVTDATDLKFLLQDSVGFMAKSHGITREKMNQWIDFQQDGGRCGGLTRKGKQCLNYVDHYIDPEKFRPGISDRCSCHRRKV